MSLLKNILMVSYLKNKGIRRICFLLGVVFSGICFCIWHQEFERTNYKLSYQTLEQAVMNNKYNNIVLKHIYRSYPVEFNFGKTFYDWENFFAGYRALTYQNIKSLCNEKADDDDTFLTIETCKKLKSYVSQPVKLEAVDLDKWYGIKWVIFWFYFPFLICLPFRWIYLGFKESKKKLDK